MKNLIFTKITLILVLTLVMGVFAMPETWKEKIPASEKSIIVVDKDDNKIEKPTFLKKVKNYVLSKKLQLGLDLAGGRELDYKIDLTKVKERNTDDDPDNDVAEATIISGVAETLRRRIDPDGTRELVIQTADYGDEKHVIVNLTADIDNEETRSKLQKQIDLQFKEQKEEADESEKEEVKKSAKKFLAQLKETEDFKTEAEKIAKNDKNINYEKKAKFKDELDEKVANKIWNKAPGTLVEEVIEYKGAYMVMGQNIIQQTNYSIFRVGEKEEVEREVGKAPEDFNQVRDQVSESDVKELKVADLSEEFKNKALELGEGDISEILENDDQFTILKMLPKKDKNEELMVSQIIIKKTQEEVIVEPEGEAVTKTEEASAVKQTPREKIDVAYERLQDRRKKETQEKLTFEEVAVTAEISPWQDTELTGEYFKVAKVGQNQFGFPVVQIQFNTDGAKLFETISERNIGKPLAIFVGGELISAPNINEKISGGSAEITTGTKNIAEAKKWAITLSRDLNSGAIPAPIELAGEVKVEASLGMDALQKSIYAGIIGLLILSVWMIFAYRLLGVVAVLALCVYAVILIFILKTSFPISMLGLDIVLTLAGIAGMVLSIGVAVDANILIFERIREELRDGKNFSAALSIGFERAWPSIRDSNVSSLITCGILFFFGTSIIKGFAVMLAIGILVSMFTAITITRTFLGVFVGTKISGKTGLFVGGKK